MIKAQIAPRKRLRAKIAGDVAKGVLRLQTKVVIPSAKRQYLKPEDGYNGFDVVIVEAVKDANGVTFSPTQRSIDELYTINYNWFSQVVGRTQEMAGTKINMTPTQIIYWLNRVKFIPQGWAGIEFTLNLDPAATGRLPNVVKGTANCEYTLGLTPTATGTL